MHLLLQPRSGAVPEVEIDNHRLARIMDTNDTWIRERSGIRTRYYVEPGVGSAELGAEAARKAIDAAGIDAEEVDYLVCATMTPDHYFPGSGTLLLELAEKGLTREDAYRLVQGHAMATWEQGGDFRDRIVGDPKITEHLSKEEIDRVFSLEHALRHVDAIFERTLSEETS